MKKILITGTSGFIGGALYEHLKNTDLSIDTFDVRDNQYFRDTWSMNIISKYDIIVHLGAISETNVTDHKAIYHHNIQDTINIIRLAKDDCKIIYASSAAVYGTKSYLDTEDNMSINLNSLNKYAQSKFITDSIITQFFPEKRCIGLRFFNVSSMDMEPHKKQPSPTFKFSQELKNTGKITLFNGSDQIRRDFIYIDDVINIIQFFINSERPDKSEVFNIGTGVAVSFEEIADSIIDSYGYGEKQYIEKPSNLSKHYQEFTQANIQKLRNFGYQNEIPSILQYINAKSRT